MKTFEYHQFLKYIYFEGYADSYEGAENLIEELDNEEIDDLYEKFVNESMLDPLIAAQKKERRRNEDATNSALARLEKLRKTLGSTKNTTRTQTNSNSNLSTAERLKELKSKLAAAEEEMRKQDANEEYVINYLISEGYTDTLESAEIIIENMSEQWLYDIIEDFIFENVSGGRGKRAKSSRAPIPQRVTARQAREIRANSRENPRPKPTEPVDNSLDAMRQRFKDAENADKEAKKPKPLPSGGIGASDRVLRGRRRRTPGGMAQARVAHLHPSNITSQEQEDRRERISAALRNRKNWGKPKAQNGEENL